MSPDTIHALEIVALVVAGTMTGNEIAVAVFFHPRISHLDDRSHVRAAQMLALALGKAMPFWYALTFLLSLAAVFLAHTAWSAPWWLAVASAALFGGMIVYSILLPVPINNQITHWQPDAPPANWRELRRRWDMLHALDVAGVEVDTEFAWEEVLQRCDVSWTKRGALEIVHRESRKAVELDVHVWSHCIHTERVDCHDFSFSIGKFSDNYYFDNSDNCSIAMDRVLRRILKVDRALLLSFVRRYVACLLDAKETVVTVADDGAVSMSGIRCTPAELSLPRCEFLLHRPLDADLHRDIQTLLRGLYEAHLADSVREAEALLEEQAAAAAAERSIEQQKAVEKGAEAARLQKKREGLLAAQESLKKFKKE